MRLQPTESYDAIINGRDLPTSTNYDPALVLFVSCPTWGANSNWGTWQICPTSSSLTTTQISQNNGTVQSYAEFFGGPGSTSLVPFTQTFSYDTLNRLTAASDVAGNQSGINGNSIKYNADNLVTAVSGTGISDAIVYDGLGQRIQRTHNGTTTTYVYDAFGLAQEYVNGAWSRDYIADGASNLFATENSSSAPCKTCYLASDHLGNIRLVMDQNANVVARHDFLPYGEEIPFSSSGTAGRTPSLGFNGTTNDAAQKFTGQVRDQEAGMDNFGSRYFTPALGRFNSPDRYFSGACLADPQQWNRYTYVRGNPMAMIDPFGEDGTFTYSGSGSGLDGSDPGDGFDWLDPGPVGGNPALFASYTPYSTTSSKPKTMADNGLEVFRQALRVIANGAVNVSNPDCQRDLDSLSRAAGVTITARDIALQAAESANYVYDGWKASSVLWDASKFGGAPIFHQEVQDLLPGWTIADGFGLAGPMFAGGPGLWAVSQVNGAAIFIDPKTALSWSGFPHAPNLLGWAMHEVLHKFGSTRFIPGGRGLRDGDLRDVLGARPDERLAKDCFR